MKIIFGTVIPTSFEFKNEVTNIDTFFYNYLKNHNNSIENAVTGLVKFFDTNENKDRYFWTCNPLIPNYCDDAWAREHFYIFVEDSLIKFGDDEHLCKKLAVMGPGEALCDDYRVLI